MTPKISTISPSSQYSCKLALIASSTALGTLDAASANSNATFSAAVYRSLSL